MDTMILEKYQALPNELQKEVLDFIEFLESKYQKQPESLAQKRASLFGNAKGLITIMPGFENVPDGFDEYQ